MEFGKICIGSIYVIWSTQKWFAFCMEFGKLWVSHIFDVLPNYLSFAFYVLYVWSDGFSLLCERDHAFNPPFEWDTQYFIVCYLWPRPLLLYLCYLWPRPSVRRVSSPIFAHYCFTDSIIKSISFIVLSIVFSSIFYSVLLIRECWQQSVVHTHWSVWFISDCARFSFLYVMKLCSYCISM